MKNLFLTCKECILESPRKFYGSFYLGPFNNSQSLTIANGLRRTLLSEIPGLGIQMVEIEGVEHEFCTYPGLRESILDLLLNFKQIILYSNLDNPENLKSKKQFKKLNLNKSTNSFLSKEPNQNYLYGYLQAKGPGIIRASDLKLPPSIQCVDPDQYIATLANDGFLNLRFMICEGLTKMQKPNLNLNDNNFNLVKKTSFFMENGNNTINSKDSTLNEISKKRKLKNSKPLWLDPVFSPILKVNYLIEAFGSQELDTANQVVLLEVWTNGSLHPRAALYKALSELYSVFSRLEKMQYLNTLFAKSILTSEKNYLKILKKVKYDYDLYKKNSLKKEKPNKQYFKINKFKNLSIKSSNIRSNYGFEKRDLFFSLEKTSIDYLELPFRITNCLKNANLLTMHSLVDCKVEYLRKLPGIGDQSLILILKKLSEKGFYLKP